MFLGDFGKLINDTRNDGGTDLYCSMIHAAGFAVGGLKEMQDSDRW